VIAALDPTAIDCPHPERLRGHNGSLLIQVNGGKGAMNLCLGCKVMFERLIAGWGAGTMGPAVVARSMRQRGYTRLDVARFLLELVTTTLRQRAALRRA
jgi:hypothetical protein